MKVQTIRTTVTDKGRVRLLTFKSTKPYAVVVELPDEPIKLIRYNHLAEATASYATKAGTIKPLESPHATTEAVK
jgi:hypothetical protein